MKPTRVLPTVRQLARTFFSWNLTDEEAARAKSGEKVKRKRKAPPGYGFNGRGDLINLRREALRRGDFNA